MVRMLAPRLPLARTAIVRPSDKQADPYYLTPEWRELRPTPVGPWAAFRGNPSGADRTGKRPKHREPKIRPRRCHRFASIGPGDAPIAR